MSTIQLAVAASMSANLGASGIGFAISPPKTVNVDGVVHDKIVKAVGAGAAVTLWDSAVDNLTAFQCGFIIVDPDGLSATQTPPQEVDIRLTINAVTHLQRRDGNVPMLLGKSAQSVGAITKIEAVPKSGSVAVTNDVNVRCVLYPAAT